MRKVVLALYDNLAAAQNAVNDLQSAGFDRGKIGLAVSESRRNLSPNATEGFVKNDDVSGEEGAGFGALVGGLTGAAAGLLAITIPGIGPVLAAGPLAAALGSLTGAALGTVAGAVTGGIIASLVDLGVSEEYAEYYAESMRRGSALVTVTVEESEMDTATNILQRHNPYDIDKRVHQWKKKGWNGFDPKAEPYTAVDRQEALAGSETTEAVDDVTLEEIDEDIERHRAGVQVFPHRPTTF